ncbi:VOC family protein [Streptomyces sp. G45]|uniref:VOC family protein n=1 Tax=Streptomyces sp. G45 TaxID=3406627 RepID=UPI003C28C13A
MAIVDAGILVLDCRDPEDLAEFYGALLGGEIAFNPSTDRFEITGESGTRMGFRRDTGFTPPSWPRPDDAHQTHLELLVAAPDMDAAEREAVKRGARPVDTNPSDDSQDVRLYCDPAGHTFALRAATRDGRTRDGRPMGGREQLT